MAGGTALGYDITQIPQGPGNIWIIGTPPTDTAVRLTLATDGTPDATAHPQSVCLGMTEGGIVTTVKQKFADITVDQFDAPVDSYIAGTDAMIEATLTQQAVDLLQQALPTGSYSTAAGPPGYKQLTVGGTSIVPTVAVAAISLKRSGSGLYRISLLYRVSSQGGITISHMRDKKSTHKVQFKGQSDIARTAGKQIGVIYETIS